MWWRSVWLAPLILFASFAWAHDPPAFPLPQLWPKPTCEPYFSTAQSLKLSQVLKDIPLLRDYILEIAEDPDVEPYVKILLKRSLLDTNIEVVNLTHEIREAWQVPKWWGAYAESSPQMVWNYPGAPTSAEDIGITNHRFATDHGVAVPDDDIYPALVTFIHELAHVRMDEFWVKNYDRICRKLPSTFAQYVDGRCLMHAEFFRLVHEKFAYETQWRVLGTIYPHYFKDKTLYRDERLADLSPKQRTPEVGKWLVENVNYKFRSAHITILWDRPVSEILMAGDRIDAIDEAVKLVVKNPGLERAPTEDFRAALSMIIFLRQARGFKKVNKTSFNSVAILLEYLISQENGPERAKRILAGAVLYADKYPECKEMLISLLNSPLVSRQLRRLGWRKRNGAYIDWNNLEKFRKRLK